MKDTSTVYIKKMLKGELLFEIKKQFTAEKRKFTKAVKEIKEMKTNLDTTIHLMNSKYELLVNQTKN